VPPPLEPTAPAMPEPVCPAGVVQSELSWEQSAEPAPGTSPLDDADDVLDLSTRQWQSQAGGDT